MAGMTRWLLGAALLAMACAPAERPVAQLIGPDGARVYHVSCAQSEAHCFLLAGQSCPFGYDYASTPQRNLLVRCKAAMAPNPYLAFSDPARPLEEQNPYVEKLLPNPYSPPATAPTPVPPLSPGPAPAPTTAPPATSAPVDFGY